MMIRFTKILKLSFLLVIGFVFGGSLFVSPTVEAAVKSKKQCVSDFEVDKTGALIRYNGNSANVVLPDNVTSIAFGVFMEHDEIETVVLPNHLLSIDECAFYGCDNLKSLDLPDSLVHIGRLAFGNCTSLNKIKIGKNLSEIMELFACGCANLSEIEVSDENTSFASVENILYDKSMQSLILCPQKVAGKICIPDSVVTIKEHAFLECEGLTEVVIGEKVKYIDEAAFYGCKNLRKVQTNAGLRKIRSYAFGRCESLEKITLGENISYIGNGAFFECDRLRALVCRSKNVEFGRDVFDKGLDLTIYAPTSSGIELYAINNRYNFENLLS